MTFKSITPCLWALHYIHDWRKTKGKNGWLVNFSSLLFVWSCVSMRGSMGSSVWWLTSAIFMFGRLRQENHGALATSLDTQSSRTGWLQLQCEQSPFFKGCVHANVSACMCVCVHMCMCYSHYSQTWINQKCVCACACAISHHCTQSLINLKCVCVIVILLRLYQKVTKLLVRIGCHV